MKSLEKEYGYAVYFFLFYLFATNIVKMLILVLWGVVAWKIIDMGYLSQSVYEHLVIVTIFSFYFFAKKEKQYALIPYITKLTTSKIRNYILVREFFSIFNFSVFATIAPALLLNNTIEKSVKTYILISISLWLIGLLLNIFTRIIKYLCLKYKSCFIYTLSIIFAYFIILVLFYRNTAILSYSNFLDNITCIIILLTVNVLLFMGYSYVIRQELYHIYDGKHIRNEFSRLFYSALGSSSIISKLQILKLLRCKIFMKFLTSMIYFIVLGIVFYLFIDFKLLGLVFYLGAYTLNMLHFTISLNSDYFDGLFTKKVSIKSLLLNAFYTHLIITTLLFIGLLVYMIIYDKTNILPYTSIYLFVSGPIAFILLHSILFAQKIDLYPVQSDNVIPQTLAQKIIRIIAGISLLGCITIIHFFPTAGCYIVLITSMLAIMTYPYWVHYLYNQFMNRKYQIMENLRKSATK